MVGCGKRLLKVRGRQVMSWGIQQVVFPLRFLLYNILCWFLAAGENFMNALSKWSFQLDFQARFSPFAIALGPSHTPPGTPASSLAVNSSTTVLAVRQLCSICFPLLPPFLLHILILVFVFTGKRKLTFPWTEVFFRSNYAGRVSFSFSLHPTAVFSVVVS